MASTWAPSMPLTEAGGLGFASRSSAGAAAEAVADAAAAFESTEMLGRGDGAAGAGITALELVGMGADDDTDTVGALVALVSSLNLGTDVRAGILPAGMLPGTLPE